MCLDLNFAKRLQLSHRVFWKEARHLTGKHFSTFVPKENFFVILRRFKAEKEEFMQESGYHSGLISKDKDHKNLPVSLFLTAANLRVDHWREGRNTSSFNDFKMALAVPVRNVHSFQWVWDICAITWVFTITHTNVRRGIPYLNPSGNSVTAWSRTISIVVAVTAFWCH